MDATFDDLVNRIQNNQMWVWVLLRLNRWVLAGSILTVVFVSLVLASHAQNSPFRVLISNHDALWWIFSAFTGVKLVVSIGQIVLSQIQ